MTNDYKLLNKVEDYDLPTVRELASAMNELAQLDQRRKYLEDIIKINGKLKKYIWQDKNGFTVALADLKDDHLKNLVAYWRRRYNDDVPQNIMREVNRRNLQLTTTLIYLQEPSFD